MTTAGPNGPSSLSSNSAVGTEAWSNPGNAGASDNSYATAALSASEISEYLVATDFGFSIPTSATIQGIEVNWERSSAGSGTGVIVDNQSRILKGGTIQGDDKADTMTLWTMTDAFAVYGGSADLWGLSWSAADINSANFGAALSVLEQSAADGETARVDYVRIFVTYTESASGSGVVATRVSRTRRHPVSRM